MNHQEADAALYLRIYAVVRQVPPGAVTTYGDVAAIVGCDARSVGYALGALGANDGDVPWQRVVSREGVISTRGLRQRELLAAEGVGFDARERVLLVRHRWAGPSAAWASEHDVRMLPPRAPGDDAEQLSLF